MITDKAAAPVGAVPQDLRTAWNAPDRWQDGERDAWAAGYNAALALQAARMGEPAIRLVIVDGPFGGIQAIRQWDNIGELPAGEYFLYTLPAQEAK